MLFHLTEHCSLNCGHCLLNATPSGKHASKEVINKTIEFAQNNPIGLLNVSGGEPTEHPQFFEVFELILKKLQGKARVLLASNGRFLEDDQFTAQLVELHRQYPFFLQVTAIKGLYPHQEQTVAAFRRQMAKHGLSEPYAMRIDELTVIDHLGRARGKDWSHLKTAGQRKAPNCFNPFSAARSGQVHSLGEIYELLAAHGKFCKPLFAYDGSVYAGESTSCYKAGNILTDTPQEIFDKLKAGKPCGHCGVDLPEEVKFIFEDQ